MKKSLYMSSGIVVTALLVAMLHPAMPVRAAGKQMPVAGTNKFCDVPTARAATPEQTAW